MRACVRACVRACSFPPGWVPPGHAVPPPPPSTPGAPITPGLLPNVTLGSERPVFVRVDLRPVDYTVEFTLSWTTDPAAAATPVPSDALSPSVSAPQAQRRKLQELAGRGWSHWCAAPGTAAMPSRRRFPAALSHVRR
jgi:hypothetical protein